MKSIFLLGIDPGFANLGYSILELTASWKKLQVAGVLCTEKSDKKRKVLAADDNVRRARQIAAVLENLVQTNSVSVICAESMSFPRNASAAAKMAMSWGIIASITERLRLPLLQVSPQELKMAVCGKKSATKEEVQASIKRQLSVEKFLSGTARSLHEHAYDSVGATLACLDSEVVRALTALTAS